ncbi:MAG: EamA family transporter [Limnochordaceae bacterium]|nr:EamA family transporter [Limnochordaceae bacterium]
MNSLLLGLLGAVCWGLAPVFGKLGLRDLSPSDGLIARSLVTLSVIAVWAAVSGRYQHLRFIAAKDWLYLGLEAFFATLAGDLAYYAALKAGSAGITAVLLSAAPIFTLWAGNLWLTESYSTLQLAGTFLVVAGIMLVAAGSGPVH